ncbi:alpha/beta hydrolase [Wenxinia marina]|uniref:Putative esterase n=1 Tax=Wenxinia marina DSM 24838 TaxID=1123501 RepID=A0A0D0QA58_9RHOB|nr:putative esterase [Wenxinia marina DSM 24838]
MTYDAARTRGAPGAPLFLTFHGTGGTERQFHGLAGQLRPGAHVVSPRGDVSESGALRYFRRTAEGVYDTDDLGRRTEAMADFIAAERAAAGADRVIGLGYSNGANILASVAFARPELVDDLILFHPLIPVRPAAGAGPDRPADPRHRRRTRPDLPAGSDARPHRPPPIRRRDRRRALAPGRARTRPVRDRGGPGFPGGLRAEGGNAKSGAKYWRRFLLMCVIWLRG